MTQYLEKFRGTIGKRQADQILKLLSLKKNAGQIRSLDEFSRRLDDLIRELTSTVLQPSLKLYLDSEDSVIGSEEFNYMLDRVEDDLAAAFEEANNVDEVQRSHEAIIRDVILKNLRAGVAELESKISLYELLNGDTNGFDSAVFSTFRESKEKRTNRGVADDFLFTDHRSSDLIEQDADVDLVGERLVLSPEDKTFHTCKNITQLFDSESPQSDRVVERPGSNIQNVIDGQKGTYWIQSVLYQTAQTSIKTKLELDLGSVKEVNFLEIEPVSQRGVYLETIQYVDGNEIVTTLVSPELLVESPVGIRIRKIATRRIVLTFRNDNPISTFFQYTDQDSLTDQAYKELEERKTVPSIKGISEELAELVRNEDTKEIIQVQVPTTQEYTGTEFTMGLDNIRVGLATYESRSIYTSTPINISPSGQIGLKVLESRPYHKPYASPSDHTIRFSSTTYDVGDDDAYFLGSIEYWIIKQDYSSKDILLRTTSLPILPLNVDRIYHERLVLTDKSSSTLLANDLGQTMFYSAYSNVQSGDVKVYRNGVELTNVDGQVDPVDGWQVYPQNVAAPHGDTVDRTPDSGTPMKLRIKIIGVLRGDIFTVSYTPSMSTIQTMSTPPYTTFDTVGGLQVVDLAGDLSARRIPGQIIVLDDIDKNRPAAYSEVFLAIILRQNTADESLSPVVEEYTLLGGNRNNTKFEE